MDYLKVIDMSFNNNDKDVKSTNYEALSDVWQKLLNRAPAEAQSVADSPTVVPPLASDPWSELLQAQGIAIVDLQKEHLHTTHTLLNEQDVEEALHLMQEQDGTGGNEG
jgi:hypothetical protein